jgi:hypothetical protein
MFAAAIGIISSAILFAGDKSADELSKESTEFCKATGKDGAPTPQTIIAKVKEGAALLAKEGLAAFPKFKGNDSKFIFNGTYIWIHDINGVMRMHPIKYKMEGKPYLNLKDRKGKMFFVEMNNVAKENPAGGWVEYVWPKPGQKGVAQKISFVKLVKVGKEELIVGCGIYDMTKADIDKALK